jgi:hypothetical protein
MDLFFPNTLGEHMNGGNLRQEYMAAVKNAGLTQFHFHDLCQILKWTASHGLFKRRALPRKVIQIRG